MTDNAPRDSASTPISASPSPVADSSELLEYAAAGLQLIPLHRYDYVDARGRRRGKSPRDGGWPVRDYTDFNAAAYMADGNNVGVRLPADWLVVDADPRNYPDGRDCLDELASRIGYSGRDDLLANYPHVVTGSGGFHVYMRKEADVTFPDTLKDEYPGIEFKSLGRQVVAAGSVHPEMFAIYRWGLTAPALGDAQVVPSALVELAGRPRAPQSTTGSGLKLSVAQVRHCLSQLPPDQFDDYDDWLAVGIACHAATDGDDDARDAWIEWSTEPGDAEYKWTTFQSDRQGPRFTGYTLLRMVEAHGGILPPHEVEEGEFEPVPYTAPEYAGVGDEWIWVADAKSFVRRADGKMYDEKQFDSLFSYLAEKGSLCSQIFKNKFPMRKFEGLSYQPGLPEFPGDGTYNLWRSSGIEPKEGDVAWFLDHVAYLVPNDPERNALLDYLAHLVQRPGDKINFALLVQGGQGTGKSALGNLLEHIIGSANVSRPTNQELRDNFTGWLRGCSLAIIEELMTGGNRELANKLKPIITDPRIRIREMYRPSYEMVNRVNLLIFTNHRNAVQIDGDDRRYFVVFSPAKPAPSAYYERLFAEIDGDGAAHVAHWLLSHDLSGFAAKGRAPMTTAKAEMRRETMGEAERHLAEMLDAGDAPFNFDLVSVEDIQAHLPGAIANRTPKLGNIIGSFLRDEAGAVRLDGRSRIGEKMRVLWALRNHEKWQAMSAAERARHYVAAHDEENF